MKKLTAEEFNALSKEEKDIQYRNLAEGEMTRYRLLYDIPVAKPVDAADLAVESIDEEIRESAESMIRVMKYFNITLSKEDEEKIRAEAEERICKKHEKYSNDI